MWLSKCSAAYYQMSIVWIVQPITYWYACILYPLWTVYSVWPSCVPQCTVGDAFTEHVVIGKIFVAQKIFVTPSVLRLQQWFLHQYGGEFKSLQEQGDFSIDLGKYYCCNILPKISAKFRSDFIVKSPFSSFGTHEFASAGWFFNWFG